MYRIRLKFLPPTSFLIILLSTLFICGNVFSSQFKTERPPYEDFLNYGIKKFKPINENENEIIKSKVEVLGQVLKNHVDKLRKVRINIKCYSKQLV